MGYFLTGLICLAVGFVGGAVVMFIFKKKVDRELEETQNKLKKALEGAGSKL